jgi:hypothetical protein
MSALEQAKPTFDPLPLAELCPTCTMPREYPGLVLVGSLASMCGDPFHAPELEESHGD